MEESVFERLADTELEHIEALLEACDDDLDVERMPGGVLEVEFEDGSKLVINRHGAAQEIWLAARSGGFHFARDESGRWVSARDGVEMYARLSEVVAAQLGRPVHFEPPVAS